MAKPTLKQRLALKELLETLEREEPFELNKIMLKSGYSKATAHNPEKNLLSKDGWQQLLADIDEKPLLKRLKEIALDKTDKRASLQGIDLIMKLKDRFPDKKMKIGMYKEREDIFE